MASSIDSIVQVTIDRQTKLPTQTGFGTPAILDINTWQTPDVAEYEEAQELLDAGASTADEAYKSALAVLSQNPRPASLKVLKRASNVAQINSVTNGGADDGTYTHKINESEFNFVASSDTIEQIRDGLVAAINGGSEPVTAAPVSTDQYTLTADTAGVGFSSEFPNNPNSNLSQVETADNVGAASELARLRQIDSDWYFLLTTDRNSTFLLQLSQAVESELILFGFETDDADSKDLPPSTDTTSLFAVLQATNRDRTFYVWTKNSNLDNYIASAIVGKMAPKVPGSATWKFKTLAGPLADDELTTTEKSNIQSKNGNVYNTIGGIAIFEEGKVAGGEFIDIIRGTDLLTVRIQEQIYTLLVNEDKVPMDDGGIEAVALQVEDVLFNIGVANAILRGGDDAPVVTVPGVNDISQADRINRFLNKISFTGFYAGAIHKAKIEGVLTV